MDSRWQELTDWFAGISAERMEFFVEVRQRILNVNPEAYGAISVRIHGQVLQSLICNDTEFANVSRFVRGDWTGTPWHAIYDATQDVDDAWWWLLVFVVDTAIAQRRQFLVEEVL